MGVTRRIIFPVLRLILWAVIAAALVKIAFAGQTITGGESPLSPSAEIVEPQVAASTGSITNTVTVTGSVVADPAVTVRATMAGTVTKVIVAAGAHVDAGAALLEITLETPVEPTVTTNPETGEQTVRENKPTIKREKVTAPTAGAATLTALKDQVVAVGDSIGAISPGTLSVSGTLTPDQQYRLLTAPTEAQVTLKGGPAPFTCTGLRIGAAPAGDGDGAGETGIDPATGQPLQAASGSVSCAVPTGITAFAGLGADLSITNGSAEGAVVVPVSAVQGSVQTGNVWVVLPDGTQEQRAVGLGLTDGQVVQITSGLVAGDQILEFIPIGDVAGVDGSGAAGGTAMLSGAGG
ncbi:efflux RND transporter periplasmic adaptor subunit [Pengzhenrongella sicca]|uniref:Secretion protein HlyD n=1 Tax=Pengzhenrongella sicca TaxID=2819238 RepID=A0A8A4ZGC1_9MICO|nr:efflux RND transporter periplasmic adaptor subunit [Pengzhenrongella sicca]QTE29993.1 secretion protein HlyD [Pengzhenrongella sicca]